MGEDINYVLEIILEKNSHEAILRKHARNDRKIENRSDISKTTSKFQGIF